MSELLLFDHSETHEGLCTRDALASPHPAHSARLLQDTAALLHRLQQHLGPPGALEDGHEWDFDLQVHDAQGQAWPWSWSSEGLCWHQMPKPDTRLRLALSVAAQARCQAELDDCLQSGA